MYNWIVVIDKLNHFQKFAWVEAHRIRPKAWGALITKNTLPAIAMVQSTINLNAAVILEVPFFWGGSIQKWSLAEEYQHKNPNPWPSCNKLPHDGDHLPPYIFGDQDCFTCTVGHLEKKLHFCGRRSCRSCFVEGDVFFMLSHSNYGPIITIKSPLTLKISDVSRPPDPHFFLDRIFHFK